MANIPVTKVSLGITDVVIVNDAATQLLKIFRANGALTGRAQAAITESLALETAISNILEKVQEAIGQ